MQRVNYYWRVFATGLSFSVFGLGALLMSLVLFPPIHLLAFDRARANHGCQYVVHLSFRLFIWMMKSLGVLTYEITGADKLAPFRGKLIIANHPTLLDVVFIVSLLPTAFCVVKKAAWSNPFLASVMWATGYIQNNEPTKLITDCVDCIEQKNNLVIFPEATRTVPGEPHKLKRGAASVIVTSKKEFIPLIITCVPPTLSKGEKWYDVPNRKVHFKIVVEGTVDPKPLLQEGEMLSKSTRRINKAINDLFARGLEVYEQPG